MKNFQWKILCRATSTPYLKRNPVLSWLRISHVLRKEAFRMKIIWILPILRAPKMRETMAIYLDTLPWEKQYIHTVTVCIKYLVESAHISAIAYCIKLEVDISKRTSFGLKKIGLRGNTIWHEPCKVSEFSHENKARAWTKLKNYFMRLTGMKKLIFRLSNFFGSGHFLIHEILKNRPKIDRSQKSYFNEKSFLSYP